MQEESKPELKSSYKRAIIKLGNSKAITFPQEWTNLAGLEEKKEVTLYPIDNKTIIIRATEKEKPKSIVKLDGIRWPVELIKQSIVSGFKLNVDEITLKYNEKTYDKLYELLIEMRKELIGIDFKNLEEKNEFYIKFLLDTTKTAFSDVLNDLINVFNTLVKKIIEGTLKENNDLLLAELDRKYYLGIRMLITAMTDYPISKGYHRTPLIRFLGDRVILLYIRDFINQALFLRFISSKMLEKYSEILMKIPQHLLDIVESYDNITLETITLFRNRLESLNSFFKKIEFEKEQSNEEFNVRSILSYYINGFQNFFDIWVTRKIEQEVGLA